MIKSLILLSLSISLVFLLAGCHDDQKQAENTHHHLKKSAEMEKTFAENEEKLSTIHNKEQSLYEKIISLNVDQTQKIQSAVQKAQKYNRKQKHVLQKAEQHFKQAFNTAAEIKSAVKKINDTKQKKTAAKILHLMKKRHNFYQSYHKAYNRLLTLNDTFYKKMAKQKYKVSQLDQQIKKINHEYENMAHLEKKFNHYTKQYNKAKNEYYRKAGLKVIS